MTALTRSRRRAEEFAALVDGERAVSAESSGGRELDRLVGVVSVMRREAGEDARPRAAFTADLRERLMAEAAEVLTPQQATLVLPPRTRGTRERRLVAAATAAVLLGGTAGMAAAAQGSLPGEALYPVKRGIESAQAGLSTSPAGEGRALLGQAGDRLDEVRGLVAAGPGGGASQIPGTLDEFTRQARRGADLMLTSYADTHDPATIAAVRSFAARDQRTLRQLAGTAPVEAQPALGDAVLALSTIDARASQACQTCSDLPPLVVPAGFRASLEADRAMHAVDAAHLDNSHPVVAPRDAVQQADGAAGATAGDLARKAAAGAAPTTAAGPAVPSRRAPDPGLLPGPTGAPSVDAPAKTKLPSLGTLTGGVTAPSPGPSAGGGDLGAGLGSAIQTLLPDVSGQPQLP
jgi:hypothetical protein